MSSLSTPIDGRIAGADARRLSPQAFAEEFMACSRTLWCIAAGVLGKRDQADDVLQEGAMIALGKLEQFDPDTSFVAWMGRIVRFVALNHARRRQRRAASALDEQTIEAPPERRDATAGAPAAPATARGELRPDQKCFDDDVCAALSTLDEIARACLLLRTVLDLPYREIALALDIPEGTAMSHVHRARRTLRDRLRHRDPDPVKAREGAP
jgi:RNA polymerase sigma-70 factor (ECF subfamily)